MNYAEKYIFDLHGCVVIKNLLEPAVATSILNTAGAIEDPIRLTVSKGPMFAGHYGLRYTYHPELATCTYATNSGEGLQIVVEDFYNASPAFDALINHAPTMAYVREFLAPGPIRIGSAELRYRYSNNYTPTHMGGVIDSRNRYNFVGRPMLDCSTNRRDEKDFNLLCIRVLYALHDIPRDNGPFCAILGSHKSNFFSPYPDDPTKEPGMVPIVMQAGDALFFTENLRHGGLPNRLETTRRTAHLMFSPAYIASQSPAHWDKHLYVAPKVWERYSADQRALFSEHATLYPPIP